MAIDPYATIERCNREIEELLIRPDVVAGECPAWLVMLGVEDWEREKRMIQEMEL